VNTDKAHFKVLIHSRDANLIRDLKEYKHNSNYHFIELKNISNLVATVYDEMPHLVIAELRLSNVAAFDNCHKMKQDVLLEHIPLIVMTEGQRGKNEVDSSADIYIQKKISPVDLSHKIHQILESTSHELDINPLTRLPGTRSSVEEIESALRRSKAFVMCSIQLKHLGSYYKRCGMRRGDSFLRRVSEMIRTKIMEIGEKNHFVGHLGERDFVAMISEEKSVEFAEKLIETFEEGLSALGATESGKDSVIMTIAIIYNENDSLRHISEVAKVSEQVQNYLGQYSHSAYLEDRRLVPRDFEQPVSPFADQNITSPMAGANSKPFNLLNSGGGMKVPTNTVIQDVMGFLANQNVETFFQPIVGYDKHIFAYEALSRFRRSDGSCIEPIRIFHAAREANVIKEFDILCATTALRNAMRLPEEGKIFINLNRETLIDIPSLAKIWKYMPKITHRLVIELTEQSLVRRLKKVEYAVAELRRRGVEVALDDTGGGSVSLREAAELRPEYVKFDRSCCHEISTSDIKQNIIASLMVFTNNLKSTTVLNAHHRSKP